jgi:hypothetical protein
MSRRADLLSAFVARLEAITVANGYETNAGQAVYLNETPALGPDDPAVAIAVLIGDDVIRATQPGKKLLLGLPLTIQAIAKADLDVAWMTVETMLSDIKRAIEQADLTIGGLAEQELQRGRTRTIVREAGETTVGLAIEYAAYYAEQWGNP